MTSHEMRSNLKTVLKYIAFAFGFIIMIGCGDDPLPNINKYLFTSSNDTDALDSLLIRAQMKYDRGDFEEAYELANKAYNIKPDSEQVIVLLSFINLSLAGIDPLQVAMKLSDMGTTSTSTSTTTSTATSLADTTSTSTSTSTSTNDTAGQLTKLSVLINLSSADFEKLGNKAVSDVAIWKDMDIIEPDKVAEDGEDTTKSPRTLVDTLRRVNDVIKLVCPFADSDILIETEPLADGVNGRHKCTATTQVRSHRAKVHLIWGLAHLTEALALNSILLYSTSGSTPNIQRRAEAMNGQTYTAATIGTYLTLVGEVATSVDTIFDTNKNSMLTATLTDMKSFLAAASKAGMPDDTIKSVKTAMDQLKATAEKMGGGASVENEATALRGQMNATVAKKVSDKINTLGTEIAASGKTGEICASYDELSKGLPADKKNTPTICPTAK